ncbi:MAG: hypothetical protein AAGA53_08415 [Pseudomonadota bacterium]
MARLVFWIGTCLFAFLPIVYLNFQDAVDPRLLLLDPMIAAEVSGDCCQTYYGFFSTLGVIFWMFTTAICGFAALILFAVSAARWRLIFALFAFGFTGWLGFDDAFLFHENIAPKIGMPQELVLLVYCALAAGYTLAGWRIIRRCDWQLFIAAGACLAASLGIDTILHSTDPGVVILEDGSKFAGIVFWFSFHLSAMRQILLEEIKGGVAYELYDVGSDYVFGAPIQNESAANRKTTRAAIVSLNP